MPKISPVQKAQFNEGYQKGEQARLRLIAWFKRLFRKG